MKHFNDITQGAIEGERDPLMVYAQLKDIKKELDKAIQQVEPLAIHEAEKYGKSFELHGVKFERRNGGKRYSFKHIEEWQYLTGEVKRFEQLSKDAYAARKNNAHFIDQNGEEIPLPEVTYTKDSLIVK